MVSLLSFFMSDFIPLIFSEIFFLNFLQITIKILVKTQIHYRSDCLVDIIQLIWVQFFVDLFESVGLYYYHCLGRKNEAENLCPPVYDRLNFS